MKAAISILLLSGPCFAQGGFNGTGRYVITNLKSGRVLDLNESNVIQNANDGSGRQIWNVMNAGDGLFWIRNWETGCALELGGPRNSTPVRCGGFNERLEQQWGIQPGKDGNPLIVSSIGKVLDIPDGTNRTGVPVQTYDRDGDSNQRFQFQQVNGRRGGFFDRDRENGRGATLSCASDDGRRHYCKADTSRGAQLVRQISGSPCTEGKTWGFDQNGVWVDRGCRAEFRTR